MRFIVLVLMLVACTTSAEEHLDDLVARAEIDCGYGGNDCFSDAEAVASCMNDALVSGKRAMLLNTRSDIDEYTFTVGNQVNVWQLKHPVSLDDDDTARELWTCSGTFVVGEQCGFESTVRRVRLEGCLRR